MCSFLSGKYTFDAEFGIKNTHPLNVSIINEMVVYVY